MPMRFTDKIDRVTHFMLGLRNPNIAERLARHGFKQADLDEGWELTKKAVGDRVDIPGYEKPEPGLLEKLDAWENLWFPIVRATLERQYPEVAEQVFLNLSQTSGSAVTLSVGTLIRRIEELESMHQEAFALIQRRGLDAGEIQRVKGMLEKISHIGEQPPIDMDARRREFEIAEDKLWAWYREWSAVARASISDGRLLRQLGFKRARSTTVEKTNEELTDDDI
jgi:hypothetical protein